MSTPRASLEELKKFANAVREAGGGNPLDALMPSVPADPGKCLIAKNLNFNCIVDTEHGEGPDGEQWGMTIDDPKVSRSIAAKLNLNLIEEYSYGSEDEEPSIAGVFLPQEIGQVADTFDNVFEAVRDAQRSKVPLAETLERYDLSMRDFTEIWPYIEESKKEAYGLATIVNDDGSIVI